MEGRQIDLLGIYKLVVCGYTKVFYVVDEKRVGLVVLSEEDDLGATSSQLASDGSTDAGRSALMTK